MQGGPLRPPRRERTHRAVGPLDGSYLKEVPLAQPPPPPRPEPVRRVRTMELRIGQTRNATRTPKGPNHAALLPPCLPPGTHRVGLLPQQLPHEAIKASNEQI
jgi:hypothetical protein